MPNQAWPRASEYRVRMSRRPMSGTAGYPALGWPWRLRGCRRRTECRYRGTPSPRSAPAHIDSPYSAPVAGAGGVPVFFAGAAGCQVEDMNASIASQAVWVPSSEASRLAIARARSPSVSSWGERMTVGIVTRGWRRLRRWVANAHRGVGPRFEEPSPISPRFEEPGAKNARRQFNRRLPDAHVAAEAAGGD